MGDYLAPESRGFDASHRTITRVMHSRARWAMGRGEALIAVGVSWQILILSLVIADSANASRDGTLYASMIGFVIVALGAFITAWEKKLAG